MRIIRAEHLGMCFGVRDAIALAKQEASRQPLTILGELVHNQTVLDDLRSSGIEIENHLSEVSTPAVMITAHGASEKALAHVRQTGLQVLEATCPLVHYAHRCLKKLVAQGYHPVVIGRRDHVEVRGLTEDFENCEVVLLPEEVANLEEHSHIGVISQTTQPIERVRHLVQLIRDHFPQSNVRFLDTVCRPTKQRQSAAVDLARQAEVVIVIGGAGSNNTRELVATCQQFCARVYHVQNAAEVRGEWTENAETIGITAGTSTPDCIIDAVERRLVELSRLERRAA